MAGAGSTQKEARREYREAVALIAKHSVLENFLLPVLVEAKLHGWSDEELLAFARDVYRAAQKDDAGAERSVKNADLDATKHGRASGLECLIKPLGKRVVAQIAVRLFPEGEGTAKAAVLHTFTAGALQGLEFPPQRPILPGILHEGLTFLVAPPKSGKSLFVIELAVAVSAGSQSFLGRPVEHADVLYRALEDGERRLQQRMQMLIGDGVPWPQNLHLATHASAIDEGLIASLEEWLAQHPQARLVIIDTLASVRRPKTGGDVYQLDYETSHALHELALQKALAVLVLHHTRKMDSSDFLKSVSGSHGVTGAADAVLVLRRQRGETDAVLHITGRDIEEGKLALTFAQGRWTLAGDGQTAVVPPAAKAQKAILAILQEAGTALPPKEIAKRAGKNASTVRTILQRMVEQGRLQQDTEGRYLPLQEERGVEKEEREDVVDGVDGVDAEKERENSVDSVDVRDSVDGVDAQDGKESPVDARDSVDTRDSVDMVDGPASSTGLVPDPEHPHTV